MLRLFRVDSLVNHHTGERVSTNTKSSQWYVALFLTVGMMLIIPLFSLPYHHGFDLGDSGFYLKYAHALTQGNLQSYLYETTFFYRVGAYLPYAVGIAVVGFGEWLNWIPVAGFALFLVYLFLVLSRWDIQVGLATVLLLVITQIWYELTPQPMADTAISMLSFLPFVLYFKVRRNVSTSSVSLGVITGVIIGYGGLTKESMAFVVPLLLWLAYSDRRTPRLWRYWKTIGVIIFLEMLGVLVWYGLVTGSPFTWIEGLFWGAPPSTTTYGMLYRMTGHEIRFLLSHVSFGVMILLAVLNLFRPVESWEERYWRYVGMGMLGMWWVASLLLQEWNQYRLWLPVLIPLTVNAAQFIVALIKAPMDFKVRWRMTGGIVVFLGIAGWALLDLYQHFETYNLNHNFFWTYVRYVGVSCVVLFSLWVPSAWWPEILPESRKVALLVIVVLHTVSLMLNLWWWYIAPVRIIPYEIEKKALVLLEGIPAPILTCQELADNYGVYNGFNNTYPLVDWSDYLEPPPESYLYVNAAWLSYNPEAEPFIEGQAYVPVVHPYIREPEEYGYCLVRQTETHRLYFYAPVEGNRD